MSSRTFNDTVMAMTTSCLKGIFRKREVKEAKVEAEREAVEAQQKVDTTQEKIIIKPKIVWECDVDGTWTAYPDDKQVMLEESYRSKTKVSLSLHGQNYKINFKATPIMQRNESTGYKRKLRRRVDTSNVPVVYHPPQEVWETVPSTWIEHENGEDLMMVKLSQGSDEWDIIEKELKSSIPNAKLHELVRIQNLHLWEYYMFRKKRIAKLSDTGPNVCRVWHGSGTVDPKTICLDRADGFMTQCSRTSAMWGAGTYFAECASYSDTSFSHYPQPNLQSLILCDLIVGDSTKLSSDERLRHGPKKPETGAYINSRYDTVTGYSRSSKIFVVYENGRAYPHYILTYSTE